MSNIAYHYSENAELVLAGQSARHYPWHVHRTHRTVGVVLGGTVTLGTREGMRILHSGACFVVEPGEVHCLTIAENTLFLALCIDVSRPIAEVKEEVGGLLTRGAEVCLSGQVGFDFAFEKLKGLEDIFAREALGSSPVEREAESCIRGIVQQLMVDPGEPLSVEEMAVAAGDSPWQFIRRFRRVMGMTPYAFRLACRLSLVRQLLRQDETAAGAAAVAGFVDQSHMHKLFRRHHGLTPRQFLKCSFRAEP